MRAKLAAVLALNLAKKAGYANLKDLPTMNKREKKTEKTVEKPVDSAHVAPKGSDNVKKASEAKDAKDLGFLKAALDLGLSGNALDSFYLAAQQKLAAAALGRLPAGGSATSGSPVASKPANTLPSGQSANAIPKSVGPETDAMKSAKGTPRQSLPGSVNQPPVSANSLADQLSKAMRAPAGEVGPAPAVRNMAPAAPQRIPAGTTTPNMYDRLKSYMPGLQTLMPAGLKTVAPPPTPILPPANNIAPGVKRGAESLLDELNRDAGVTARAATAQPPVKQVHRLPGGNDHRTRVNKPITATGAKPVDR